MAGFPVIERMTCPIGGEPFDFTSTAAYTIFGSRPDGRPYGSWTFPLALPECPGNGLIVYKERFEPAELRRLEGLIASADYRALRGGDVQYYRLYWLLRAMDAPRGEVLGALIQAGWQAPEGSPLRARYLRELIDATPAVEDAPADLSGYAMRGRRINALRELGRFEEAAALLAGTSLEPLRPGGTLAGAEADDRAGWLAFFAMMESLIARRDGSAEPLDFLPRNVAAARCASNEAEMDARGRAFCAQPEISEMIRNIREATEELKNAARALEAEADD